MNDIMEDLETRGTVAGCAIVSIGLAAFCPKTGEVDDGFYTVVNYSAQRNYGLHVSDDGPDSTEAWWRKQTPEARVAYDASLNDQGVSVIRALEMRNEYIRSFQGNGGVRIWGNGADFDNAIINAIYHRVGVKPAHGPYQGRCYRTIKNLRKDIKLVRVGTHHNALDDAKSQAHHLIDITQALGLVLA